MEHIPFFKKCLDFSDYKSKTQLKNSDNTEESTFESKVAGHGGVCFVVLATWEAAARGSLEPKSSGLWVCYTNWEFTLNQASIW